MVVFLAFQAASKRRLQDSLAIGRSELPGERYGGKEFMIVGHLGRLQYLFGQRNKKLTRISL
jgi:hypothetical protein